MKNLIIQFICIAAFLWVAWPVIRKQKTKHRGRVRFGIVLTATQGTNTMNKIAATLAALWAVAVTAVFEDASGTPRKVVGTPAWDSSDTSIATVTPATDGLSASIVGVAPGTATITVTAEGDPTPGNDTITGEIDVTIVETEATQVVLTLGTPTPPATP